MPPHLHDPLASSVLCFSHLRWNFVYQRPQHLMTRLQKRAQVIFFEEPVFSAEGVPRLASVEQTSGVVVVTPHLPQGISREETIEFERQLLNQLLAASGIRRFVSWYYTPMALEFSDHLKPEVTVYDCMDQLSAFDGASPRMSELEARLFRRADVVFAGGASLFEDKRKRHSNVHLFASSIDRDHFLTGRTSQGDADDQREIPHPRIGFFGVLDERLDRELLRGIATARPDWHFVLIGPTAKISQDDLPRATNIHYLGQKSYSELPGYLANWDVAMLPFAQNASTRFISPTKTPEYLAAGKPVVSTPIRDVVNPYGANGLVRIAGTPEEFIDAIEASLRPPDSQWLSGVDAMLGGMSWDKTFEGMWKELERCRVQGISVPALSEQANEGSRANV